MQSSDGLITSAESVWQAYFQSYSRALADPSVEPSSVAPYLTQAENKVIQPAIAKFQQSGKRVSGATATRNFSPVKVDAKNRTLIALVCVDNQASRVVDSNRRDATPKDRKSEFTLRLTFLTEKSKLLLDKDETWSESVC